jgi:hypothetical protein
VWRQESPTLARIQTPVSMHSQASVVDFGFAWLLCPFIAIWRSEPAFHSRFAYTRTVGLPTCLPRAPWEAAARHQIPGSSWLFSPYHRIRNVFARRGYGSLLLLGHQHKTGGRRAPLVSAPSTSTRPASTPLTMCGALLDMASNRAGVYNLDQFPLYPYLDCRYVATCTPILAWCNY